MEEETENTVERDQGKVAVATCHFTADDNKPWEISVPKGSLLKVLKSNEKWCKVKVNGQIGYAPAYCLKPLTPVVSTIAHPIQSGSKRHLVSDHLIESQQLSFVDAKISENGGTSVEELTDCLDKCKRQGRDVQHEVENPRRRSSRLAEKPVAAPAKKSKVDLTWKAALERGQQNNSPLLEIFNTVSTGGRVPFGPRDIFKAPGLNKISVFPDIPVKIEKVEPLDETESTPQSESRVLSSESVDKGYLEFEAHVVKEEVVLEDHPNNLCSNSRSGESKDVELEFAESPRKNIGLNGEFVNVNPTRSNIPQPTTSYLRIPTSSKNSYSSSPEIVSFPKSLKETSLELDTHVVKEDVVLEDLPNKLSFTSSSGFSKTLEVELNTFPRHDLALNGASLCLSLNTEFIMRNRAQTQISPLLIQIPTENTNPICSPVTSPRALSVSKPVPVSKTHTSTCNVMESVIPIPTSIVAVSETQTLDNSNNPCCILFAKVWKVLGLLYEPVSKYGENKTIAGYVLNLRLVCNDWRAGVDKFYENLPDALLDPMFEPKSLGLQKPNSLIFKIRNKIRKLVPSTRQAFTFNNSSKIEKFINHFRDTHSLSEPLAAQRKNNKNPILGRFVSFSTGIATVALEDEDTSRVAELLRKYGSHVWFCTISIDLGIFTARRHILLRVFEWLQLMPNLKHFTWKSNFDEEDSLETGQYIFPYMKNLKRVVLEALPEEIKLLILQSNFHIDTLSTKILLPQSVKLSNLKTLNLSIHSDDEFKMLEMLKQHWPLLESLTLLLHLENTGITWRRAMKVLERWKNTLTHVSILLPKPPPRPQNRRLLNLDYDLKRLPYRLDLPRVKYLKLNFAEGFVSLNRDASLDFISPLRESLEYLHLEYYSDYEYTRQIFSCKSWMLPNNQQIPFFFGYKSNIWNNFLKLKKVYVNRYHDQPDSFYYVPFTFSRNWWCFHPQSQKRVLRPTRKSFEMGECNYREFFPRDYVTVQNTNHVNRAFEMAVTDLFSAWQSLNDTDVDLDREQNLKENYLNSLQQLASQGIYTSFGVYKHSNYTSNANRGKCMLCPNEPFIAEEKAVEDHFWNTHFLYAGTYKCDFMGCEETFPSKYDVVEHRRTHGQKHKKVFYDLEALPVHNFPSLEMAQIFNWIHVDAPQGFLKSGCWP